MVAGATFLCCSSLGQAVTMVPTSMREPACPFPHTPSVYVQCPTPPPPPPLCHYGAHALEPGSWECVVFPETQTVPVEAVDISFFPVTF